MLGHVVMFKFRDSASAADKELALELLRGMPGKTSDTKDWRIGEQYVPSEKRWDVVEMATFADEAALIRFQESPAHKELTDHMREVADWHVVDYQF